MKIFQLLLAASMVMLLSCGGEDENPQTQQQTYAKALESGTWKVYSYHTKDWQELLITQCDFEFPYSIDPTYWTAFVESSYKFFSDGASKRIDNCDGYTQDDEWEIRGNILWMREFSDDTRHLNIVSINGNTAVFKSDLLPGMANGDELVVTFKRQ